jgi:N-acetylglucosaminyldiphosphoundecaprenol N-acetyl-beta-D-mannosaminyltransferase
MQLLGVRIDTLTRPEALQQIELFLASGGHHSVFTPNPEMLVKAYRDTSFCEVLNAGSLNVCDGRGVELLASEKVTRISGVDVMLDVCALAERSQKSIFLLGSGSDVVVQQLATRLHKQFPRLIIAGFHKGASYREQAFDAHRVGAPLLVPNDPAEDAEVRRAVESASPAILFVAFGMGKQEKWIAENIRHLPSVRVAIGVGGAFDYLSGRVSRAPLLLRKLGLEWLYRVIRQPWRVGRIWNAVVVFTYLVITKK